MKSLISGDQVKCMAELERAAWFARMALGAPSRSIQKPSVEPPKQPPRLLGC